MSYLNRDARREVIVLAAMRVALRGGFSAMSMWHEETLKIIQRGTEAGEFTPKDHAGSIAWRLIALVCGLDGIYALGMEEIDDATFNRHINYFISMELF